MTEPTIYYTTCFEGKNKYFLAIEANNLSEYNSELKQFLDDNPGVQSGGYIEMTPGEYKSYLKGY